MLHDYSNLEPADVVCAALEDAEDDLISEWGLESEVPPDGMKPAKHSEARSVVARAETLIDIACQLIRPNGIEPSALAEPTWLRKEAALFREQLDELAASVGDSPPALIDERMRERLFLSLDALTKSLDPIAKERLWRCWMQIRAADLLPDLRLMSRRLEDLATYAVRIPGNLTRNYLSRVARCYAFGFEPETKIMARAALESALEAVADDAVVRAKSGGADAKQYLSIADRIKYCHREGLLSGDGKEHAFAVVEAANMEIHTAAGSSKPDAGEVIKRLRFVLLELEAHSRTGM
jgi:hypothetical protein